MPRPSIIDEAEAAFSRLNEAVDGLDDAHFTTVFYDAWDLRGLLAHIAGWQRLNAEMMERMARGEPPVTDGTSYDDSDAWNATFATEAAALTGATVVQSLQDSFWRFIEAAEALPPERLAEGRTAWRMLRGNGIDHIHEHLPAIEDYIRSLDA